MAEMGMQLTLKQDCQSLAPRLRRGSASLVVVLPAADRDMISLDISRHRMSRLHLILAWNHGQLM